MPKLLEILSLKGCIVTADALNCQRTIAPKVTEQGGDCVLALKGNQDCLHDDVRCAEAKGCGTSSPRSSACRNWSGHSSTHQLSPTLPTGE